MTAATAMPAWSRTFYWASVRLSEGLLRMLGRWTAEGREHVADGPLILASNHLGNVDPMVLAVAVRRRHVRFMAKEELFEGPLSPFVRAWGAFPVRRGGSDREAMRLAEATVRAGGLLGMFPEGTRSATGALGEMHGGTAVIALRTNTPILPCRLTNTNLLGKPRSLWPRPRVSARFGEPIAAARAPGSLGPQARALTERLREALEALA